MNHPDPRTTLHHAPGWFTSSHTGQGQNCLEITHAIPGWVGIRDSKQPHATLLATPHYHWQTFLNHITTTHPTPPHTTIQHGAEDPISQ